MHLLRIFLTLLFLAPLSAEYYSQYGQDQFVHEKFFKDKKNGVFIDIGAYDGKSLSNTFFFEKELGWKGICIEPLPHVYQKLKENRSCTCIQGCIAEQNGTVSFMQVDGVEMLSGVVDKYDPEHIKRIESEIKTHKGSSQIIEVPSYNLNDLLEKQGITHIDFLSLDTEGGELEILKSIDFDRFRIEVIAVENNYNSKEFKKFLKSKGYKFVQSLHCDEIYKRRSGGFWAYLKEKFQ